MKPLKATITALLLSICLSSQAIGAGVTYVDNMASFLSASGASSIGTLPSSGGSGTPVGSVTFTSGPGASILFSQIYTNEFTNELVVSVVENFNMAIAGGAYSFGFQIHEPTYSLPDFPSNFGCNAPCFDTTFRFEFFSGTTSLGQFLYNAPDDASSAAGGPLGFFGFHSDVSFNRIEVRDMGPNGTGTIDNEYFGNFVMGSTPLAAPIPEPATYGMLLVGLALLGFEARRRKKV